MISLNKNLTASQKGEIVELKCSAFLLENGWNVSVPCGNFLKYDLIMEKNGKFHSIQCKKSIPIDGGFYVKTEHDLKVGSKSIKVPYDPSDCDFFMTEADGNFYMFPVDGKRKTTFRTTSEAKKKSQRLADDYLADTYLELIEKLN